MFIDSNTSREDLQCIILNEKELYALIDEIKFLDDGYSNEELLTLIRDWVEAGDECAA